MPRMLAVRASAGRACRRFNEAEALMPRMQPRASAMASPAFRRFNEAEALMPRMLSVFPQAAIARRSCFNEAEALMPRMRPRGFGGVRSDAGASMRPRR